jgi:hypothetical protein
MTRHLGTAALALGLATALSACGSTNRAVATSVDGSNATSAKRLPILKVGTYAGREPTTLSFSADGGNIVTHLRWSSWTATLAVGHGVSNLDNCVPSCAGGKSSPVATAITLMLVHQGHFTVMTERRDGQTLRSTFPNGGWPRGATGS